MNTDKHTADSQGRRDWRSGLAVAGFVYSPLAVLLGTAAAIGLT